MKKPDNISEVVKKSLQKWMKDNPHYYETNNCNVMDKLQWDYLDGCWYFWYNNVYYGVETDGYIHT